MSGYVSEDEICALIEGLARFRRDHGFEVEELEALVRYYAQLRIQLDLFKLAFEGQIDVGWNGTEPLWRKREYWQNPDWVFISEKPM